MIFTPALLKDAEHTVSAKHGDIRRMSVIITGFGIVLTVYYVKYTVLLDTLQVL